MTTEDSVDIYEIEAGDQLIVAQVGFVGAPRVDRITIKIKCNENGGEYAIDLDSYQIYPIQHLKAFKSLLWLRLIINQAFENKAKRIKRGISDRFDEITKKIEDAANFAVELLHLEETDLCLSRNINTADEYEFLRQSKSGRGIVNTRVTNMERHS
eukprot:TRINITY_DN1978_c0_g1_i5.p1 TRINITY_DN1978_c0_g1~~TRINITY_DN1978_c0_g1_i5.p1  ORF type:complete len:156 (-),score=12.27 TRINITY_DN1978_c0_g1_i5:614-1081(-)